MNGHERRRQQITDRVKQTALELFSQCGADQVSMDEIATRAEVSKVTIYKYFHDKAGLQKAVINLYVDRVLADAEKILDSDLGFMDKLKFTLTARLASPKVAGAQNLFELLEKERRFGEGKVAGLNQRIKEIMFKFYEQGKKDGFIEESLSFELLYLFSQIVEAGFKARGDDLAPVIADPAAFDQLLSIYYFGIFRKI